MCRNIGMLSRLNVAVKINGAVLPETNLRK